MGLLDARLWDPDDGKRSRGGLVHRGVRAALATPTNLTVLQSEHLVPAPTELLLLTHIQRRKLLQSLMGTCPLRQNTFHGSGAGTKNPAAPASYGPPLWQELVLREPPDQGRHELQSRFYTFKRHNKETHQLKDDVKLSVDLS